MKTLALFCGTFSPMHLGHLNILRKAEDIFGKGNVEIRIGINPDKINSDSKEQYIKDLENHCKDIQEKTGTKADFYLGFLHDHIDSLEKTFGYNVVIVKGLRNGDDLNYEINQLRFINDFKKDVKTIFITCDKEYEHISSSAIKKLDQFGGYDATKKYLI